MHLIAPAAVLLLGAILVLFGEPIALPVGEFLVIRDDLQSADVIHVVARYQLSWGLLKDWLAPLDRE